ncbi:hypothetical protein PINS_up010421 [Pythium insidiosum]|nr:hypothetical protein PINS_up010421 [Pythium insidiosum]
MVGIETLCADTCGVSFSTGAESLLQHVASAAHKCKVHAFCKHHRCDAKQELRVRLWLRANEYHELLQRLRETQTNALLPPASDTQTVASTPRTRPMEEAFLTSAVSQLERVRSSQHVPTAERATQQSTAPSDSAPSSLLGPRVDHRIKTRTLTSPDGILQNALGVHDGVRVWGGGIVKIRKSEWLPWGIDLLVTAELERQLDAGAGAGSATVTATVTMHRVTERALAHGLATVPRVAWGDAVANVHSVAAVPPWMVDTEDEYRSRNQRVASASTAPPTDDVFARLATSAYDEKTWLPNFGSVWQDGPRAKTRAAFQQLSKRPRSKKNDVPSVSSSSSSSVRSESSTSESITAPPRSEPSPPLPPPPPSPPLPPAAISTPLSEPTTPSSELDAKKQALLAQKERLRAKLAAKRKKP